MQTLRSLRQRHSHKKPRTSGRLTSRSRVRKSRKNVASELEKTEQYLKDLEPACVSGDSSYEKRKEARDKEIEALKKAQDFLDDVPEKKAAVFLSGISRRN